MINVKYKAITMVNSITSRQESGEIQVISRIFYFSFSKWVHQLSANGSFMTDLLTLFLDNPTPVLCREFYTGILHNH